MQHAPPGESTHERTWTIAELADEFGLTSRALRFYEERGLLLPQRIGTQRIYNERDRNRLHWIERAKSVGFSLQEAGEMLDLYDPDGDRNVQRRFTLERCKTQLTKLEQQQKDIVWAMGVLDDFIKDVEGRLGTNSKED